MSKAKGKAKNKGGKPAAQQPKADDDLDAILAEFGMSVDDAQSAGDAAPAAGLGAITSDFLMSAPQAAKEEPQKPQQAAESVSKEQEVKEEEDDGDEGEGAGESKAAKDKKKKKKKGKAAAAAAAPAEEKQEEAKAQPAKPGKISAAGRLVAERLAKQREEEERVRQLQEAEEARIRAEDEAFEAEQKRIADEKERKKQAKKEKLERQKQEGTYRTKAQKEAERKQRERLEQMIAAGLVETSALENPEALDTSKKARPVYGRRKPKQQDQKREEEDLEQKKREEEEKRARALKAEQDAAKAAAAQPEEEEEDDWEAEADEVLAQPDEVVAVDNGDEWEEEEEEEEDELEIEKRKHQDLVRQRGLERARLDRERKQREEEERQAREEQERLEAEAAARKEASRQRRKRREEEALAARSADFLRAPISVIMGHVDTGKTKLLDKIRHTNVQEGEAGGITQQIGATYFVKSTLETQTEEIRQMSPLDIRVPGLLVMDTPGHESFTNLRSRGSSLCDVAILVIDLMHGLEPQTIESLNMLKKRNAPFIVALNKIDRCYGWVTCPNKPVRESFKAQDSNTMGEFHDRFQRVKVQLMEQGLNAALYWENDSPEDTISLVPTSAVTGEGVPDLIWNLISISQTRLLERIMSVDVLQCTVLEVKVIEGLGTTIDVVLVNGKLRQGDTIVISTMDGPVVTNIRALLTPPPSTEMRVKSEYHHHDEIRGAIGVKIAANGLERAVAGSPVLVVEREDDVEDIKDEIVRDFAGIMKHLDKDQRGVMVQASTLGALEALLQFLREETKPPIPVSSVNIGPIYKRDIMRANLMNEKGHPEFATILAFDVRVDAEAAEFAESMGVRIFTADIIYHLFDQFTRFYGEFEEQKRAEAQEVAVFPCVVKILPQYVFNNKDPIVVGVEVIDGIVKVGTPLCIPSTGLFVGRVVGIESNHREIPFVRKGQSAAIKIQNAENPNITFGRQFDHSSPLYSRISRESIDAIKKYFVKDLKKEDLLLLAKLKRVFNVPDALPGK